MIAAIVGLFVALPQPEWHSRTLPNGAQVFAAKVEAANFVSVQAFVRVGSAFETSDLSGSTHLLEHMLFEGSAMSAPGEVDREIEAVGGFANATTYRELMRIRIEAPASEWITALGALGKLLAKPTCDPTRVAAEGAVIREEIGLQDLDTLRALDNRLWSAAYGSSGYGLRTSGGAQNLEKLSPSQLLATYDRHFVGRNIVLVIVGGGDAEETLSKAAETLGRLPSGSRVLMAEISAPAAGRVVEDSPTEENAVGFAFFAPGMDDASGFFAAQILASRLSRRANATLGDSVRSSVFFGPTDRGGLMTVLFRGVPEEGTLESAALKALEKERAGMSRQEFDAERDGLKRSLARRASAPSELAFGTGVFAALGRSDIVGQESRIVEDVTHERYQRLASGLDPLAAVVVVWRGD